jgi:DNA repair protein RecN (Recombination protein N)
VDGVTTALTEAADLVEDAARSLRSYADRVTVDPARLQLVDERLQLYGDLARKYGGSTAAAVGFLEQGRERLAALEAAADDLTDLCTRREAARARSLELAALLSDRRRAAAPRLEAAIEQQVADLGMSNTQVMVEVSSRPGWDGLGPAGADTVTFLLAPNPGVPARSLARTASGGELSRTLLAIKAALADWEDPETLVFDEIDAGIGGLTAMAVGRKLFEISRSCQTVVVTHLPQVAAHAERHYLIDKLVEDGLTITRLIQLDEEASLRELSRMLGGRRGDAGALEHARTLRDRATSGLLD